MVRKSKTDKILGIYSSVKAMWSIKAMWMLGNTNGY